MSREYLFRPAPSRKPTPAASSVRHSETRPALQRLIGNQAMIRLLRAATASPMNKAGEPGRAAPDSLQRKPQQAALAFDDGARDSVGARGVAETSRTPAPIQASSVVGTAGDPCEREAERVAERVTRADRPLRSSDGPSLEDKTAQRRLEPSGRQDDGWRPEQLPTHGASSIETPPVVNEAIRSSGQPLDSSTRAFMESRFGRDFGQIRVHADKTAAEAARALRANAFTTGKDIVFGEGRYAPETREGRRLLAHELTHSVQQGADGGRLSGSIQRDASAEAEVKKVISPNLRMRETALKEVEDQLAKRLEKRRKEIQDLLDQLGPAPKSEAAKKRGAALQADLAKDLKAIVAKPDHPSVNKDLRKDIIESAKHVDVQKLKLKSAEEQWSKYDPIFAGEAVAKAEKAGGLSPAELKALVAQESGDLTKNDTTGDIAGVAQLGTVEEKRAGGAKGDRKKPEKAIPLAAKLLSLYGADLDKGLSAKPTGEERKKFIMGAYNGGVALIITAQRKAIKMKRTGLTWDSLVEGGEGSPLFQAIQEHYKEKVWSSKYKEVTEYVVNIYARIP